MTYAKGKLRNILVVAITRMGDMLQASPTILGLKRENPDARITVVLEKQFASICDGIPGIDEIFVMDLGYVCRCLAQEREGLVDAFKYLTEKVDDLKSRDFDFCLNMSSSGYTALLLKMLEIKECRGWVSDEEGNRIIASPWAMLFSAFVYHSNRDYNSINIVDIFRCCAEVKEHPHHLIYNVSEDGRKFAREFIEREVHSGTGPLICMQAGASQGKRQWAPARFARVARLLIEQLDARIILTGSNSELPIIEAIANATGHPNVTILAGKTDFAQLAGVLEAAEVLITGDTGPMHLSVAVGTPVVSIFLASALCFETGPYGEGNFVIQPQISCNPCNPNFPCSRPDCHDQITPELVAHLVQKRLEHDSPSLQGVAIDSKYADPREVAVYVTTFDGEGFLDFQQVNGISPRRGNPGEFYSASREAYRDLWKEEFDGHDMTSVKLNSALSRVVKEDSLAQPSLQGIQRMVELTNEGDALLGQLQKAIRDSSVPAKTLGDLNTRIQELDKNIEEVGLSCPVIGALARLFVMERENMRGDDPLLLASEMKALYSRLASRSEKFGRLFVYHEAQLKG